MLDGLLKKQVRSDAQTAGMLASYDGKPAFFYQESPSDTDPLWDKSCYPRADYNVDIACNPERKSGGTLQINIWCTSESESMPEDIEKKFRELINGTFYSSTDKAVCAAWNRSDAFSFDNRTIDSRTIPEIIGVTMLFDLMEFPVQITTDPDPVQGLNEWTKAYFPELIVIAHDRLPDIWKPTDKNPAIYWRFADANTDDKQSSYAVTWFIGHFAAHIMADSVTERNRWIKAAVGSLDITKIFGSGGTTNIIAEQFKGGAKLVYAIRIGTGGKKGSYQIKDSADMVAVNLEMKYEGSRMFNVTIRPTLADTEQKELLLLEGTTVIEKFIFNAGEDEAHNLIDAAAKSEYFTLTKASDTPQTLAVIDQAEITTGENPTVNTEAYSSAFERLEAYRWNVLSIDTNYTAVTSLMQLFLNRCFENGKFVMGVIGEGKDVSFADRTAHAEEYNDKQMCYVGNGFVDTSGKEYEGYLAAARIAGLIAGTPSNESITHVNISGATNLTEIFTNEQYERAIRSGMLTFSLSASNTVWVESGINTLISPSSNEDEGWKKIKRTKIRFELIQRLNDTAEPLIGRISNDEDGQMAIIQAANEVCNSMVAEKKLLAGAHCELDPDNKPKGDSAWFLIYADDIDALEKMYFTFKFRFAPEETE